MWFRGVAPRMPTSDEAPSGRVGPMVVSGTHFVSGASLCPPFPSGLQRAVFGMGCFWGAEKRFWPLSGVYTTAVGYSGGLTPNPTYREVCEGLTGHAEVVLVVFNPEKITYDELLAQFWEGHDPTQGMRQGNDVGTQYRSVVYCNDGQQLAAAGRAKEAYGQALGESGYGAITTEVAAAHDFYYAEDYHQQYLAKNPSGYCGLGGTGVTCPVGLTA